jgi:hypothetical protein
MSVFKIVLVVCLISVFSCPCFAVDQISTPIKNENNIMNITIDSPAVIEQEITVDGSEITVEDAIVMESTAMVVEVMENVVEEEIVDAIERLERLLQVVGVPVHSREQVARAVHIASKKYFVSPELIIALAKTESNFKKYAKSPTGRYRGYMQIPYNRYDAMSNFLKGAEILRGKLKYTNGNQLKAICLYKGWGKKPPKRGIVQARKVISLCNKLQKM